MLGIMKEHPIRDIRILAARDLQSPAEMEEILPVSEKAAATVRNGREEVQRILRREDDRFLVIAGPCSIHDPKAAADYAARLMELRRKYEDRLCILMRVYFEKPRTTVGWRGLILDPGLDGTADIARGLKLAREILLQVNELGLPAGSEMLDPFVPQYTASIPEGPAHSGRRSLQNLSSTLPWRRKGHSPFLSDPASSGTVFGRHTTVRWSDTPPHCRRAFSG